MTMTISTTTINNNQRRQALCNLPCLFAFPPSANKQHPAHPGIDNDAINHNHDVHDVYKMQQYEHDRMKTAYLQINWFVRRLSLLLEDVLQKEEEEDGSNKKSLHRDGEDPDPTNTSTTKHRRKRLTDVIVDLFGKQHMKMLMVANDNDSIISSSQHQQQQQSGGTARRDFMMFEWTIFDVQQLANKMASWDESLLGGGEGSREKNTSSFSLIMSKLLESILSSQSNQEEQEEVNNPNRASNNSNSGVDKDKDMMKCWKSMLHEYGSTSSSSTDAYNGFHNNSLNLNSSSISSSSSFSLFEHVLSMPLFHAASQIMKSYNNNNNNCNHEDEVDDSTTNRATPPPPPATTTSSITRNDQDTNTNTMISNYLQYQAACIHDQLHYFILPSLQTKLLQQEEQQPRQQTRRVKQLDQLYNTAFESWDDYCLTVLGVSSDVLPLFPQNVSDSCDRSSNHNHCDDENTTNTNNDKKKKELLKSKLLDDYARNDVAQCVFEPMRKELRQLSERFLSSLVSFDTISTITTKTNDYQNVKGGGGGGDGMVVVQGNTKAGTTTANAATNSNKKCFVGRDIANAIVYYRQFTKFIALTTRSGGSGGKKKGGSNEDEETRGGLFDEEQLLSTLYQFATSSTNSSSSSSTKWYRF